MSKRALRTVVGGFIVVGLAILVGARPIFRAGEPSSHAARFVLYFRHGVGGLKVGAPVQVKGIEIGAVTDVRINFAHLAQAPADVRIPVLIEIDADRLQAEGATIDLEDPETLDRLIAQGLRASLESLDPFTGQKYIALDFAPGTSVELLRDPAVPYREIPVRSTRGEKVQEDVARMVDELSQIDFGGLARSMREVIDRANAILAKPELARAVERLQRVTADLDATLIQARDTMRDYGPDGRLGQRLAMTAKNVEDMTGQAASTLTSMGRLLAFDGPLLLTVEATLDEVHSAARSLRRLTDQLGRDPGSLLRGGQN